MRWLLTAAVLTTSLSVPVAIPVTAHACSCVYGPDAPGSSSTSQVRQGCSPTPRPNSASTVTPPTTNSISGRSSSVRSAPVPSWPPALKVPPAEPGRRSAPSIWSSPAPISPSGRRGQTTPTRPPHPPLTPAPAKPRSRSTAAASAGRRSTSGRPRCHRHPMGIVDHRPRRDRADRGSRGQMAPPTPTPPIVA